MTTVDTQQQAFAAIKDKRTYWRNKLKSVLSAFPEGLTTEDACYHIQSGYDAVSPLKTPLNDIYKSLQPRTSEAHEELQIFDTGKRRENESGRNAIVWALVVNDEQKQLAIKQTLKKEKPHGNAHLWGEMRQAQYAYAALQSDENAMKLYKRTMMWSLHTAEKIRKSKFSDNNATE